MERQIIDKTKSATFNEGAINGNFEELFGRPSGGTSSGGVTTENTGEGFRDGGEYIECVYEVDDISSATVLLNTNPSSYVGGDTMIVDGTEVTLARSYQFTVKGWHTVKFTPKGATLLDYTFNHVYCLLRVYLPSAVTTIGARAFNEARGLRVVAFGENAVGTQILADQYGRMTDIVLMAETPPNAVFGLNSNAALVAHVKPSALAAYKADTNWSAYADRITDEPLAVSNELYNESGMLIDINPLCGKSIVFMGDSFTQGYSEDGEHYKPWPLFMCSKLHAVCMKNYAVAGYNWADNAYPQAKALIESDLRPDYVLFFMGVNDHKSTIGDIVYQRGRVAAYEAEESHTYTSGMQAALELLQANLPDTIIKVGWTPNGGQYFTNPTQHNVNTLIERMKEVALLYSVEYVETRCCGFSTMASSGEYFEYHPAVPNPSSRYHPAQLGHKVIGESLAKTMLCHL